MILSFVWTSAAYEAGKKTATRRLWQPQTFEKWVRAWEQGHVVHKAYSKIPLAGGQPLTPAFFQLTEPPEKQALSVMTERDLILEGGLWSSLEEFWALFGGNPETVVAVIRFRPLFTKKGDVLCNQSLKK